MNRSIVVAAFLATAIAGAASADTFTYSGAGGALPDGVAFSNTITVPDTFSITDVNVALNSLTHTYFSDLEILIRHGATGVTLFLKQGGDSDPNGTFIFDDEAASSVNNITTTGGSFRPVQPLSAFDGESSTGEWILSIGDSGLGDSGSLGSWTLSLTTAVPEPATWAMMILGFGGVGATLRVVRRRASTTA